MEVKAMIRCPVYVYCAVYRGQSNDFLSNFGKKKIELGADRMIENTLQS